MSEQYLTSTHCNIAAVILLGAQHQVSPFSHWVVRGIHTCVRYVRAICCRRRFQARTPGFSAATPLFAREVLEGDQHPPHRRRISICRELVPPASTRTAIPLKHYKPMGQTQRWDKTNGVSGTSVVEAPPATPRAFDTCAHPFSDTHLPPNGILNPCASRSGPMCRYT